VPRSLRWHKRLGFQRCAFDIDTGTVLWSGELPASAQATPMTYRAPSGKQLVVIAAGGHTALRTKIGDSIVAFALP